MQMIRYSLLSFCLAFLGLPVYIYLPKFYHDNYGLSLSHIGIILLAMRLSDALFDPIIGWLSDRFTLSRKKYFIIFAIGIFLSFNGFFYAPKNHALLVFSLCSFFSYIFYSFLTINYYSLGLFITQDYSLRTKLASFREISGFIGILCASILPNIISFQLYGLLFGLSLFVAIIFLPNILNKQIITNTDSLLFKLKLIWSNKKLTTIIIIFFLNSLPVSITSNLFIFYIDYVLDAKQYGGIFLGIYFLAAAIGSYICQLLQKDKTDLVIIFMIIALLSFMASYFVTSQNLWLFYFICIFSGIAVGCELVLFASLAADIIGDKFQDSNSIFGIWNSCSKISLALAAGICLPILNIDGINIPKQLTMLYIILPLILKSLAIISIIFFKSQEHK